jgi:cytochrome c-type protein NapB
VLFAIAIAVAVVGFITGTRDLRNASGPVATVQSAQAIHAQVSPASRTMPAYGDMRQGDYRANAGLYANADEILQRGLPDAFAPVELTDEERARAIEERRTRRAYDGAPPTIPHAVGQREPSGCLVCHERGANVAGRIAPPISHARYTSCLQCHVVGKAPFTVEGRAIDGGAENSFSGNAWGTGTRAWPGAPPTIPHPTWMRSECTSCHGPAGKLGLRSSHPWRASCQQCHAPSATLDQRPPQPTEATP